MSDPADRGTAGLTSGASHGSYGFELAPSHGAVSRPTLLEAFQADAMRRDDAVLGAVVRAYVHDLAEAGTPPERVLVQVKRAFAEASCRANPDPYLDAVRLSRIVGWSIEAYYR